MKFIARRGFTIEKSQTKRTLSDRHSIEFGPGPSIALIPAGHTPVPKLQTTAELLCCTFEVEYISRIAAEIGHPADERVAPRVGLRDQSMERLLNLLLDELDADVPAGGLYIDSLGYALATRYVLMNGSVSESALPQRILCRIRDKIESDFNKEISLNVLAKESGYSRAHFLRMFRVATGITPHQYVLDVRLHHAQESLKRKGANLIEIAAWCGFSSQSHMTSVFRKRLGVTPAEYRRARWEKG